MGYSLLTQKRIFSIFRKSSLSITNAVLLKNIFILTYVTRIFVTYFLAFDVIDPRYGE